MTSVNAPKAVVTGAGSGIGLATGRRLVREGFSVTAIDRDEIGLERAAAEGMLPLKADLASAEDRDTVVEAAQGSRCLVNAAGIIVLKPILEVTAADLDRVFQVNVQAVWDLTARIGSAMPAGGSVVNVSSVSAKITSTLETAAYAMTKAAVLSVTRSFAYAFAKKDVRVNAVCPGIIDTPMQDAVLDRISAIRGISAEELGELRMRMVPMARGAEPDECAATIWFLLSPDSSYMTGQAVNVDGGLAMH